MQIQYEKDFDPTVLKDLAAKGHLLLQSPPDSGFAAQTAIAVRNGHISAVLDERRGGSISLI